MCGIAGMAGDRAWINPANLEQMLVTLIPRGPDDQGTFFSDHGRCALGHRRLSIVDLSGGRQPLASADGQVVAVVNGEIYNFQGIRKGLEQRGYRFQTDSDSEVMAHGFHADGLDLFGQLNGMFAAAIYDGRDQSLTLVRDRMGQKPLYFAVVPNASATFLFGSELKAILAHPNFDAKLSISGLATYLTYESLPGSTSILEGVQKVDAGGWARFSLSNARVTTGRYWQWAWPGQEEERSDEAWLHTLESRFLDSVKRRLLADVPLGVFLSGGIDSSLVAAAMAKVAPASQVKTFCIAFEDASFDESAHAKAVAQHLKTQHFESTLSPQTMIDTVPHIATLLCEPLGDASIVPTYFLSKFARQEVKVALGGDGGDELFLGYPTFVAEAALRWMDDRIPLSTQKVAGKQLLRLADWLPVSRKNFSFDFKVKRLLQGLGFDPRLRHQAWMTSFLPDQLSAILSPEAREAAQHSSPLAMIHRVVDDSQATSWDQKNLVQYSAFYLTSDVLQKVDRASMAHGLEVRAPFLDPTLLSLAAGLPGHLKVHKRQTKVLLRRLARRWLPSAIVQRPKKGFGVPIAEWLRGPLRSWAHDLLHPDRLKRDGWFEPGVVARMLDEHDRGQADHRKPLFTLLGFQVWHDIYLKQARSP